MINIDACPICDSKTFQPFLSCKDYTVSQETFHIAECEHCKFKMTTPRPENLGRYYLSDAYISHAKKANSILDQIYIAARRITLKWKLDLIRKYSSPPDKLLDYGCGTGQFLKACQDNGWTINGFEPSSIARGHAEALVNTSLASTFLQFQHETFSIITLWHVLEHVEDLNETIQTLSSSLAKSGTMFIAVPNYNSHDATIYKEYWAAYDVPRHLWHFSQQTMDQLLAKNSLKVIGIEPMKLDSFYVSLLSEKYSNPTKSTIARMISAVSNGLRSNINAKQTTEYSSLIYIVKK